MKKRGGRKKGQIWVETVIYTLIGLSIIGLVMAVALPKINEKKDEVAIDQAINSLQNINDKIYEVQRAAGNRRVIDLDIGKGILIIDMESNTLSWVLDSRFRYSEIDVPVPLGSINVTTKRANPYRVEILIKYGFDIRYKNQTIGTKELNAAPTPYQLFVEYLGKNTEGNIIINLFEN
jgi:type II secretory pathway pseudopilin PulG